MAVRDLPGNWAHAVLVVAVGVLLSAGVVNVLIAVVESVLWPLPPGLDPAQCAVEAHLGPAPKFLQYPEA